MNERQVKQLMSDNYNNYLKEALVLREGTFATMSVLSTAFLGIIAAVLIAEDKVNVRLMLISLFSLVFVSIVALGIFVFGNRKSIKELSEKIKGIATRNVSNSIVIAEQGVLGYELELLYCLLVIGIVLFVLALF